MKEDINDLLAFLNECSAVFNISQPFLLSVTIGAESTFLQKFHTWNENTGIRFSIVRLTDQRYVIYI